MINFKQIFTLIYGLFIVFSGNIFSQSIKSPGASDSIDIIHYDLNINLVYLSQKKISGVAEIAFVPKLTGINNISLDLLKLNVDSVKVNASLANFNYNDTVIRITTPQNKGIPSGDTAYLTVYYHGQPVKDASGWGGFYFANDSSYAYNLGVGFDADPHSFGRVWFPCIDDFRDKATYDFKIRVKNTNTAVCNGLLVDNYCAGDNTAIYHWKIKSPIPAYLASVAVGKYSLISDTYNGINANIPISIYVRPSDSSKALTSFSNLKDILNAYETHYGPYLWERIGYVGVPFSNGAMEHSTNIAYPNVCIDGTLNYESLLAHELSHHWFGNLITCSTEEDMWINEGWATYCESIYKEALYGINSYKNNIRTQHKDVLQKAHITDGSYLALYGIPHNYTYGTTVYDKGADVVHTLRHYLGDDLFFNTVTNLLSHNPYSNINSTGLRDSLSALSGVDLFDFFESYVFNPGFPHFSIDSFKLIPSSTGNMCIVYMRQKQKGTSFFANSNKIELSFFDNNWNIYTDTIYFSGQYGNATFELPFVPDFIIADLNEKIADATVDNYKIIKATGVHNFSDTYFIADVNQISDSAFIRVENSWVAPDPFKNPLPCIVLSNHRYWKIDGIFPQNFNAKGRFYYSKLNHLDNQLITSHADSLVILYRKNTTNDWQIVPTVRTGSSNSGYLIIDTLQIGEYVLGIKACNHPLEINQLNKNLNLNLKVFPNPSKNIFNFSFNNPLPSTLKIFNTNGSLIYKTEVEPNQNKAVWNSHNNLAGTYLVFLNEKNTNKIIGQNKLIVIK